MDIKSSLINSKDMKLVKDSLIKISEIDHEENFRVDMLEYINDSSDNNDDEFFFDMLGYVRFLYPSLNDVAYTDKYHLIWMNAPAGGNGLIGKHVRQWDYIYCHECLHQLWDTFGVADRIKEEGKEYDHYTLNIASDCVINDYLTYFRKKEEPKSLINPQYIREKFGVEYNRNKDTQYTLYLKLLEVKDQLKDDEICQNSQDSQESQGGQGGQSGQSGQGGQSGKSGQSGQSGQGGQGGQSNKNESAKDAADRAEKAAKNAQDAANKAKDNNEEGAGDKQTAANEAKEAGKDAKDAAKKAAKAANEGDKDEEAKQTKKAKEAADKAEKAAKEAGSGEGKGEGKDGGKSEGEGKGEGKGNNKGKDKDAGGKGQGHEGSDLGEESDVDLEEIKKNAEEIINKYKQKLGGDLGKFIEQCKASKALKDTGLVTQVQKGVSAWNQKLNQACNAYVKNKVFKKQKEYKRTYQKVKRGSGFVEYGKPIIRGKKLKDDKLIINVAFYIDVSGSMESCIKDVFRASYSIAEALNKNFGKERVVDKTDFSMYAFNMALHKIEWGKEMSANGGTMDFDDLLGRIVKETNNYMINIIITDAEFNIKENEVNKFLNDVEGFVIFVTNNSSSPVEEIAKKNKLKLLYIQADSQFTTKGEA